MGRAQPRVRVFNHVARARDERFNMSSMAGLKDWSAKRRAVNQLLNAVQSAAGNLVSQVQHQDQLDGLKADAGLR